MTEEEFATGALGRPLLAARGLTKRFPGLTALDDVSLTVRSGEVVAIVGQNGSGKSTLVKVLAGVYAADAGTVRILDEQRAELPAADAQNSLRFIHQDLGLIATLNTIENLDLSRRLGRSALRPNRSGAERRAAERLIARFGTGFDVEAPVGQLSAAEQRIVAMARALADLSTPSSVLVLDEPTASSSDAEVQRLFEAVRRAASAGAGVLFISHRLDEVLALADRIVALRDGRVVADQPARDVDADTLVALIAGGALKGIDEQHAPDAGPIALSVEGISGGSVREASLNVRRGEVVGVAGILGSGREHVAGLIFGALDRVRGEVRVDGRTVKGGGPHAAIRAGIGFVPEDRHRLGAHMDFSATENLTLPHLVPLRRRIGRLDTKAERADAAVWFERVDLRPRDPDKPLGQFSGGNQQKVVLARWLRMNPAVLLLDEPTQGVDVAAKNSIYRMLADAAASGMAGLVSSSDMKELAAICDRVLVFRDGRVAASLSGAELTEANLVRRSIETDESRERTS